MNNNEMKYRINKLMDDSEIDPNILNDIDDDKELLNTINETLLIEKEKNDIINYENNYSNKLSNNNLNTNINYSDKKLNSEFLAFKDDCSKDFDNIHSTLDLYENIIIKTQEDINILKTKNDDFSSILNEQSNLKRIVENHNLLKDSIEIMQENVDNIVGKFTEHKENTIITTRQLDNKIEKLTDLILNLINKLE